MASQSRSAGKRKIHSPTSFGYRSSCMHTLFLCANVNAKQKKDLFRFVTIFNYSLIFASLHFWSQKLVVLRDRLSLAVPIHFKQITSVCLHANSHGQLADSRENITQAETPSQLPKKLGGLVESRVRRTRLSSRTSRLVPASIRLVSIRRPVSLRLLAARGADSLRDLSPRAQVAGGAPNLVRMECDAHSKRLAAAC